MSVHRYVYSVKSTRGMGDILWWDEMVFYFFHTLYMEELFMLLTDSIYAIDLNYSIPPLYKVMYDTYTRSY